MQSYSCQASPLTDGDLYDYHHKIAFLARFQFEYKEDVDHLIETLRAERHSIQQQIPIKQQGRTKQELNNDAVYTQWWLSALSAQRVKTRQIAYLRELRHTLPHKPSLWQVACKLKDYILSLPSDVIVPSEIMLVIVEFEKMRGSKL